MISSANLRLLKSVYQSIVNNFHIILITMALIATIHLKVMWLGPDKILLMLHVLRPVHLFLLIFIPFATIAHYIIHKPRAVYLVNYACFRPDSSWRATMPNYVEHERLSPFFDNISFRFLTRMLERSGLGNETYFAPALHYIPPDRSLSEARAEAEQVIFTVIDDLLNKICINLDAIDMLIVNCSIFNPTPSLTDMIVSRYKLRSDIHSVQLSGMGCSAGLIAVDLARNYLQTVPYGAHALVVSTEILTGVYYIGKKREMQLTNMLFRNGGAAVLLSASRTNARFQLAHIVRKSTGDHDSAYRCVFQQEDDEGNLGINLSKDLLDVAGKALKDNITTIGRHILPESEQLAFLLSYITGKLLNAKTDMYIPDFRLAFEHFCVHAGGRAVIDAVQRNLHLSDKNVEPSRMTLYRFGNTSSSSLWYQLAYIDAKGQMRKGDRVWMIGFGSGYKCNSAVWKCIQSVKNIDRAWVDCIRRYPIDVSRKSSGGSC